jgi:ABC-type bacteriocin/lantibiotic exporter with double-glycine peptidase domain
MVLSSPKQMSIWTVFKQSTDYDCGPRAVMFAAALCDQCIGDAFAADLCETTGEGTSHQQIVGALEGLNLSPVVQTGSLRAPCIVNCLCAEDGEIDGHYMVVIHSGGQWMTVFDPADGCVKSVPTEEFKRIWRSFRYPPDQWSVSFHK